MANEQQQEQKRTASQRIDDLERALMSLYQTTDSIARDTMVLKDAAKLLGNKLDAVVKLSNREISQNINDDAISKIMVENNVADLKEKVTGLIAQGILVASEEITDTSFVVGQELDEQDNVVNPRLQFALNAVNEDLRAKIKASKIGEVIVLQEGKLKLKVLESYSIQAPKPAEAAPAVEAAPAPTEDTTAEQTSAQPAEAQSSSDDASTQSAPDNQGSVS
jgi:hypothetical protein